MLRQRTLFSLLCLLLLLAGVIKANPAIGNVTRANSIYGPTVNSNLGSGGIVELPNGNIVIASPQWNASRGAVTCLTPAEYRAGNFQVNTSNSLTGSQPNHSVGSSITVLTNGNYVVSSPFWDNGGSAADAGAVTWVSGDTCTPFNEVSRNAVVSASNSLIGTTANDQVGFAVYPLPNGHYLVKSPLWDNAAAANAGAVTWSSGLGGTVGNVSETNSLVGSSLSDNISSGGITILSNNNFVIASPFWNDGGFTDAGAVTWGNGDGTPLLAGTISSGNSLIGSTINDQVGSGGVFDLGNNNYAVVSYHWDNTAPLVTNAGAVTWGDGATGITGTVNSGNSLIGSATDDLMGSGGLSVLPNGNYVVSSPLWDDGSPFNVGAVTWVNGSNGHTVGAVSPGATINVSNSLIGTTSDDQIGSDGVQVLSNGNYVVRSSFWDNVPSTATDAGAVTWGSSLTGVNGVVGSTNSLIGTSNFDSVGLSPVVALINSDHYVVPVPDWDNGGTADAGAVVWGDGLIGTAGIVSTANALYGSTDNDAVGSDIIALTNGNYVVVSPDWTNGGAASAGAVTWVNGTNGHAAGEIVKGAAVSSGNSLVGSTGDDNVGLCGVTALINGNYVVCSNLVDHESIVDAGAVTWGDGSSGITGTILVSNSLYGTTLNDQVGSDGVIALANGNYVVVSTLWNKAGVTDAGAVTWGCGCGSTTGAVSAANSLVGDDDDQIGSAGVLALSNGNYVVRSPLWNRLGVTDPGAVTWGNGNGGTAGLVSVTNSIAGRFNNDNVGSDPVYELTNGNYVVVATQFDYLMTNAGAVAWGDGTYGTAAIIDDTNALLGVTASDFVGDGGIFALSDGGYLVRSTQWDDGAVMNASAITYSEGLRAPDVIVTITGADTAVGENGVQDAFSVVLNSHPASAVTITMNFNTDLTINGDNSGNVDLIFDGTNWNVPQNVTVAAGIDSLVEGQEISNLSFGVTSTDLDYDNLPLNPIGITVNDNDSANIVFNSPDSTIPEAQTAYSTDARLVITSSPAGGALATDATVAILPFPLSAIAADFTVPTTSVTFPAGSAEGALQPIDINVTNDDIDEDAETFSLSFGTTTSNITASGTHPVSIADDDTAGVTIDKNTLTVTEGGANDTYTIRLNSEPSGGVTVALNSDAGGSLSISTTQVSFDATNWDLPQTVTVSAVDDAAEESTGNYQIFHSVSGTDSKYNTVSVSSVSVTVNDNDNGTSGVTLSKLTATVTEGGATDSYTIVLNSAPSADVTINTTTGTDITLSPSTLSFTSGNWNIPQTVTITAVDDTNSEIGESILVVHSVVSVDTAYNGLTVANLLVNVVDNEPTTVEVITNGGFETPNPDKPKLPASWVSAGMNKDKLMCEVEDADDFSNTGLCAFRFKGDDGENARLTQSRTNLTSLTTGKTLNASFHYMTNNAKPRLKVKLIIFYSDSTLVGSRKITINTVSQDEYRIETLQPYIIENGIVKKIKFQFQNRATAGKIYLDDVSVSYNP